MRVISHRGNLNGREKSKENIFSRIKLVNQLGIDVEIDVTYKDGKLYLGHDYAQEEFANLHKLSSNESASIYIHVKDIRAYETVLKYTRIYDNVHTFLHQNDPSVLVSNGCLWTYPDKPVVASSILVLDETNGPDLIVHNKNYGIYGICTDYPLVHLEYINV